MQQGYKSFHIFREDTVTSLRNDYSTFVFKNRGFFVNIRPPPPSKKAKQFEMNDFWAIKSLKGDRCFLIKDDFSEDMYFELSMHKILCPLLQKVHFVRQVGLRQDWFNLKWG